jgi:hypothetical protein
MIDVVAGQIENDSQDETKRQTEIQTAEALRYCLLLCLRLKSLAWEA